MNFEALTEFYFTDLVMLVCNFLALVGARKIPIAANLRLIKAYITLSFLFNSIIYLANIIFNPSRALIVFEGTMVSAYMLMELTFLSLFFRMQTGELFVKRLLSILYSSFITLWLLVYFFHPKFLNDSVAALAEIESFGIILLGFISFQSKLKEVKVSDFVKSAEFYIFIGVIGYFSFSVPYFLCRLILGRLDGNFIPVCECLNLLLCAAFFLTIRKGFHVVYQK